LLQLHRLRLVLHGSYLLLTQGPGEQVAHIGARPFTDEVENRRRKSDHSVV
jgi:hypothetical protein